MTLHTRKHLYLGFYLPLLLLLAHCSYYLGWTIDDPYISYRYAENLVKGLGLVFNAGERVEGYSNFLFTIALAGFNALGLSPVLVSRFLGFGSALLLLWVVFRALQKELLVINSALPLIRYFPLYLLALNGSFSLWAVSGMETGVYALLVSLSWLALLSEPRTFKAEIFTGGLLLLVALSRPEGLLFFALSFITDFMRCLLPGSADKKTRFNLLVRTLVFIVPYAGYTLWRLFYYQSLLPNTFYAKATGEFAGRIRTGLNYVFQFVINNGSLLYLLCLFPILSINIKKVPIRRTLEFMLAGLVFNIYCGGDWMPLWRFLVPVLPMLFYLIATGLAECWRRLKIGDQYFYRRDFVLVLIIILLGLSLWQERRGTAPVMRSVRDGTFYHPNIYAGEWLRQNTPDSARVAGEEAGIIPYYSRRYFIDMIGIVEPHIARLKGEMHHKLDAPYILRRQPEYIVLICKVLHPGEKKIEALYPSGQQMLAQPEFMQQYEPVVKFLRGNPQLGFSQLVIFKRIN